MFCIVGADGFFGAYIQRKLLAEKEPVLALNHTKAVFKDDDSVTNLKFELEKSENFFDVLQLLKGREVNIIYLAGIHNPDYIRKNTERARCINIDCYRNFLKTVSACNIKSLFFASSDTVYGESKGDRFFSEEDPVNPINLYGEQKAEAEIITIEFGGTVLRFPYLFGPSVTYKPHFFDRLTAELNEGKEIRMFSDYIRSSITYLTASEYLTRLALSGTSEHIFNICADSPTSKYDIGLKAAAVARADTALVKAISMNETDVFDEKRAEKILMSNSKLKKTLNIKEEINFDML